MGENVFLFVPNLIGYARVVLCIVACYFMPTSPWTCIGLYLLSEFLDAFDGHAARYFGQCTKFGAVLDMVTDRCSTLCLFVILGHFYPEYLLAFQMLAVLDISSHWIHMYSSLVRGEQSHKIIDLSANPILRHYYTNKMVLFFFCSANELFFASLYFLHFSAGPMLPVPWDSVPWGVWTLMAYASAPFCMCKQIISIVQMVVASKNLALVDMSERSKLRS